MRRVRFLAPVTEIKNRGIMKNRRVIFIAFDQPLNADSDLRRKMANAESRAQRQSPRFAGLDLYAIQKAVNKNLLSLQLQLDGRFMGLLDLMNYLKNNRSHPHLTPGNVSKYYTLAHIVTLNGIYMYQYLRNEGYEPLIVQNYSLANISNVMDERPLAVCISSNFVYLDDIYKMATKIKEIDPQVPVIAGGMLIKKVLDAGKGLSSQTLDWLSGFHGKVDAFVVEAQGEQTLVRLLHALGEGTDPGKIPNLALFDDDGTIFFTPRERESIHMDQTAIDWDRIPRRYLSKTLPVNSSRGCYYRCRFCTYHRLFPEVHYKSLEVLREELKKIQELGFVTHIRFTDDNFTANRRRLVSVLKMMIEEKFDFKWSSYARAGSLSGELINLMKSSGCEFMDMGIESGSQRILDNMDKKLKREKAVEAIQGLNENGVYGEGGFIVGYPGETRETFLETVDLINTSGLPYYHPYLFYYSKDMLVNEEKDRFGLSGLGRAWRHNTMDSVEASQLMTQMLKRIDHGFTDGQTSIWETFKLLRAEGYGPVEIFDLFRLKRELQLALEQSLPDHKPTPEAEEVLKRMTAMIR